jgi:O-antigen/teichoic acid export membrane protein
MLALAVSGFSSAWMPYFMSFLDKPDEACRRFSRLCTYYVFGFGGLSLLFFLFARFVVMLLTQPAFQAAYTVVGFSAAAVFLGGLFNVLLAPVYFARDVKSITLTQAVAMVVVVGLNLPLIARFGLIGAGAGLMLGFLVLVIVQQAWNWTHRGRYLVVEYEWSRLARFALVYPLFMMVGLYSRKLPIVAEGLYAIGGSIVLGVVLVAFLTRHERRSLWAEIASVVAWLPKRPVTPINAGLTGR